jgi:formate/nitrite transporter FocA (FNT family)
MIRKIWAVIFLLQIPKSFYKAYQLPHGSSVNVPEFLGNVIGGLIIALFLWKKWKKDEIPSIDEEVSIEK